MATQTQRTDLERAAQAAGFDLTEDHRIVVRDALVEEMRRSIKVLGEFLAKHLQGDNGSDLEDARTWLRMAAGLADMLDLLDPPGWRGSGPARWTEPRPRKTNSEAVAS